MIAHAYSSPGTRNSVYTASSFLLFLALETQTLSSILTALKMELTEEAKQEWLTRLIGCQGNVQGFIFFCEDDQNHGEVTQWRDCTRLRRSIFVPTKYHLRSSRSQVYRIITEGVKYSIVIRCPKFRNLEIDVVEMYKNHGKTRAGCVLVHCVCACKTSKTRKQTNGSLSVKLEWRRFPSLNSIFHGIYRVFIITQVLVLLLPSDW